jgi:MFS family permease
LYRKLSARYGALTMLTAAFGLFAVAYLLFALPASYFITFISVCLVGIATGFAMPTVTNTLARESTSVTSGRIMGGFSVMFYLGEFMSSVILIPILTVAGSYGNMYVYLGCTSVLIFVIFVAMAVHSRSMEIAQWHRK